MADNDIYYAVRGAHIGCVYGSHIRRLDMPVAHGSYIRDIPMMNEEDCQVGIEANIPPFGACRSSENTNVKIVIQDATDLMPVPTDDSGQNFAVPAVPVEGRLCTPVLGPKWSDAKKDTLVDGLPALTVNCTIACSCGGEGAVIFFMDNGQGVE
ncbi:MAG: DUF4280 domain-containing protein [Clostridiales bacterium]|jgi:hypothetical protein|nr:DUF4280 domain-containing protein [Clostridiales bacterium]